MTIPFAFAREPEQLYFDGPVEVCDQKALEQQHGKIKGYMLDGSWRTLAEIAAQLHYPEASVSAQLRHLRKPRFGSYRVEKRRRGDTRQWEYRVGL